MIRAHEMKSRLRTVHIYGNLVVAFLETINFANESWEMRKFTAKVLYNPNYNKWVSQKATWRIYNFCYVFQTRSSIRNHRSLKRLLRKEGTLLYGTIDLLVMLLKPNSILSIVKTQWVTTKLGELNLQWALKRVSIATEGFEENSIIILTSIQLCYSISLC